LIFGGNSPGRKAEAIASSKATGSLNGAAQEARWAFRLDGIVKGRLGVQKLTLVQSGGVWDVGLEVDVSREDVT